jgi:hypothetical protein
MRFFTQLMLISLLATLMSCNKSGGGGSSSPSQESHSPEQTDDTKKPSGPTSEPSPTVTPAPTPSPSVTPTPTPTPEPPKEPKEDVVMIRAAAELVDIDDVTRKDKLERSIQLLETILNHTLFRQRVLAYTYKGVKAFVDNEGQSNEIIFQTILDASENLTPGKDHTINVQLTFYYSSSSTVGYTTVTTRLIKINTKFFDQYSHSEVAGNLAHEWMHKLGYDHASHYSESRDHSVPYAIGYLVADMGEEIEGE